MRVLVAAEETRKTDGYLPSSGSVISHDWEPPREQWPKLQVDGDAAR